MAFRGPLRRKFDPPKMQNHKRTHVFPSKRSTVSSLHSSVVRIEDHESEVLGCDFHPTGKFILSANRSGQIYVGDIHGVLARTKVLTGHRAAVTEVHFSNDGSDVYSSSADGTVGVWDTFQGTRKSCFSGHTAGVNCVQSARMQYPILCSGSDDGTLRIWDVREKDHMVTMNNGNPVAATCFTANGRYVISGGHEKTLNIWDLRMHAMVFNLHGHDEEITGLSLSPCGNLMLSRAADCSLRIWDIRPGATIRCVKHFSSHIPREEGLKRCAWSPDGKMITAGTGDLDIYVWDALTGKTLHQLSAHEDSVNEVRFHPHEPILMSGGNDKYAFLNELQTNK